MSVEDYLKGNNIKVDQMSAKLFNYLIKIEYDGTKFVGWQYQKNGKSIQEKIEKAIFRILKLKIKIIKEN